MTDSNPSNPSNSDPLSPVPHTASFPHQTSSSVSTRTPYIDTSTPAINAAPVELDGVPTSPEELKQKDTGELEGEGGVAGEGGMTGRVRKGSVVSPGLGEEEDINEEFLGEGERGVGREVREKRAAMLASRSKDPGVIVDVPNDPTAEEVEAAKSADGMTTPGMPAAVDGLAK